MANGLSDGSGLVRGDAFPLYRVVPGVPSGVTVTEGWLTVKDDVDDNDASATFQKNITISDNPGQGHVEEDGADGVAVLRFDLTTTDTLAVSADTRYYYDIQVRTSDSQIHTIESDFETWKEQVTRDT